MAYKITQPLLKIKKNPYLDRFRRKPAITKLDKPFTPNHNLSQNFATSTSSIFKPYNCQSSHD